MKHIVLINGKKQSKLSVFDRSVQFGDGLFETCVVKDRKILFWSEHFSRLERGRKKLKINEVGSGQWLKDIAKAISISKLDNAVVKIILSRGESLRGYGFDEKITPTRIVIISSLPEKVPDEYALTLCKSGYATNQILSGIKHCNRLEQVLARSDMSADECIMLDENGHVISTTQANIFAIKSNVILTPALDECGIEGTRREVILKIARELGMQVDVCSLSVSELLESDEVFIANSVIGIKSVSKINQQQFDQHVTTEKVKHALFSLQNLNSSSKALKSSKRRILGWVVAISTILIFSAYYWFKDVQVEKPTIYQLSSGANIHSIAAELEKLNYINSSQYLIFLAKFLKLDNQLKQGYYELVPNMGIAALLHNFSSSKVATIKITLVEGKTIKDYYQQLINHSALKYQDGFDQTMKSIGIKKPYEGKFWPDTYQVNYGDSVLSVLQRANKIMQEKLNNAWQARHKNLALNNANEALILASLIERETAHHAEKAQIAGVFINRLQKGMRLQTDPSVIYALGEQYHGKLSKKDLRINSPYNTYRNKGLPPGAIGSVGYESLNAATQPLQTEALYFVSKKDGTHAFAKTYQQHRRNIKKYLN